MWQRAIFHHVRNLLAAHSGPLWLKRPQRGNRKHFLAQKAAGAPLAGPRQGNRHGLRRGRAAPEPLLARTPRSPVASGKEDVFRGCSTNMAFGPYGVHKRGRAQHQSAKGQRLLDLGAPICPQVMPFESVRRCRTEVVLEVDQSRSVWMRRTNFIWLVDNRASCQHLNWSILGRIIE